MATLAFTQEIAAFERLLPKLRSQFGSAWAVIVGDDCKGGFPDFAKAAAFAVQNFGSAEFLIRHTDDRQAQIPFVAIDDNLDL